MANGTETQHLLLGFVSLETPSEDAYLGAILVTDKQGVPQEFRCTHTVRPTAIQKPLYGGTLEAYIGVELCGTPLLKSVQKTPSLVLVNREFLLDMRRATSCAVAYVRRAGEAIEIESAGGTPDRAPARDRVESGTGRFQPIVLSPHPHFEGDRSYAREVLQDVFSYLDPLEPFERITKAIDVLRKQDSRFQ